MHTYDRVRSPAPVVPNRPAPSLPRLVLSAALLGASLGTGCADASSTPVLWEASIDTVADTVVVRTLAGSEWPDTMELIPEFSIGVLEGPNEYILGRIVSIAVDSRGRIWAVDAQVPELRVFGADGTYLMTVGRPGEGPGELKSPDGGMAVLSDDRVLVRDPGNARIQVYSPEGEPLDTWRIRGSFRTSNPLWWDREDNVYTQVLMDPEADLDDWRMGLAKIGPGGGSFDTIPVPDAGWEAPFVEGRSENSISRNSVPFSAGETWALHPDGYFLHGIGDAYSFSLLREREDHGGLPVRIERRYESLPVESGEAAEQRTRITRQMEASFPGWKWNGPPIPDTKPAFRSLLVGRDGRIWVQVSAPGYRVEDPDHDPSDPTSVPDEWKEPVAFDVFEPDGTYLGHVRAPEGFGLYPTPVFDGEEVWAVAQDELDVQRIVRYRMEPVTRP